MHLARLAVLPVLVALLTVQTGAQPPKTTPEVGQWHEFAGAWSATGRRVTLPAEDRRTAALIQLSGIVTVSGEVDNWVEKRAVERAIWSIPGVRALHDHLVIA